MDFVYEPTINLIIYLQAGSRHAWPSWPPLKSSEFSRSGMQSIACRFSYHQEFALKLCESEKKERNRPATAFQKNS